MFQEIPLIHTSSACAYDSHLWGYTSLSEPACVTFREIVGSLPASLGAILGDWKGEIVVFNLFSADLPR